MKRSPSAARTAMCQVGHHEARRANCRTVNYDRCRENVMGSALNNHHRDTLERILSHPASGNIEWREVLSLLNAVGAVDQEPNGKVKVTVGPETEVLNPPRGKDIDVQMVVDLRRMLRSAGFAGARAAKDARSRDHGDGRRGSPT
jgi:hypothetical protein